MADPRRDRQGVVRYRVTGLAAEAAFFAILSLPPLIFGLAGAIGFVAQRFDVRTIDEFRDQVLDAGRPGPHPSAVDKVIEPTLDEVLSGGRFAVISIGFVIALWSGSRALNVFVDTITIMYGLGGRAELRQDPGPVLHALPGLPAGRGRPAAAGAGRALVRRPAPAGQLDGLGRLYWPVVLLGSVFLLATLYHVAMPVRTRWRADLPGAALTLALWVGGSTLLRLVLSATGGTSIYGPLAAPIAVLIWLYIISIAVLIGAAFNAALDRLWPRLSGLQRDRTAST